MAGCDKEEGKKEEKNPLIGMWKEKTPYHDGICDTIVFNENGVIEKYFPFIGSSYVISHDNKLTVSSNGKPTLDFEYLLRGDTLTVFNFMDRSATQEIKNISFVKIR
jgi:hypothetical protein